MGIGIRNTAVGIRNPTNDWNPESKFHGKRCGKQYLESGTHEVESRIQDCLGFPHMGDTRLIVEVLGRAMRTKITLRQEALTELETNPVRH